jgi:hypothetical protein
VCGKAGLAVRIRLENDKFCQECVGPIVEDLSNNEGSIGPQPNAPSERILGRSRSLL